MTHASNYRIARVLFGISIIISIFFGPKEGPLFFAALFMLADIGSRTPGG